MVRRLFYSGWYEGYSILDGMKAIQSNAIESSHKEMKSFHLRERSPPVKFMKGKGREMIEEWSNERSHLIAIEDRVVNNSNTKIYELKPIITANEIGEAVKTKLKMFKPFDDKDIYITSDTKLIKDKYECRTYLNDMKQCKFNDFDDMIAKMNDYRVINLNKDMWQNSQCTCPDGLKKYKCKHITVLASRLDLCSFENYCDELPLTSKKRKGAPTKTAKALARQANDLQEDDLQARPSKGPKRKNAEIDGEEPLRRSKRSKKC